MPPAKEFSGASGMRAVVWSPGQWAEILRELDGLTP
jgi:hypothetical protein